MKLCSSELVAMITAIINSSLESSTVPDVFKQAVVRPVLKKVTLDEDAICSYRQISNLQFLSKLVEKEIARQLNVHLDMNTLRDPFQSAYRHGHSTETASLRVKNDIAATLDEKGKVVLVMLDLSSAFDTINNNPPDESTATLGRHYRRNTFMAPFAHNNNNNNNNFLCANILENQAQWRDKTKGLSNCVNVEQCVSR